MRHLPARFARAARLSQAILTRASITLIAALLPLLPVSAQEPLRIATFHTELSQKGPGLMLRALERDKDQSLRAVLDTIVAAKADVLVLQGLDWDHGERALQALGKQLRARGVDYPHGFTARPNAGVPSGLDLDGDGRPDGPGDSLGWGRFTGQGGMAVLSRLPILRDEIIDLTGLLWRDLADHQMPLWPDGRPFPSEAAQAIWPLSSVNHWALPVALPDGQRLWLLCFHAAPPVFDGEEDRNGRRNADEIRLWQQVITGELPTAVTAPFVIAGSANLDPLRGEGRQEAIRDLLNLPALQDPNPKDAAGHDHTVTWERAGQMRVDYLLPSVDLAIRQSGILRDTGSRHDLIWIDLRLDTSP